MVQLLGGQDFPECAYIVCPYNDTNTGVRVCGKPITVPKYQSCRGSTFPALNFLAAALNYSCLNKDLGEVFGCMGQ